MKTGSVRYGSWTITYSPKAIPIKNFDYDFVHDDHDGINSLCGSADSVESAKRDINETDWGYVFWDEGLIELEG